MPLIPFPLLAATPTIADHWLAVAVGAAFLLLQISLCGAFVWKMRRQRAQLKRAAKEAQPSQALLSRHARSFPWLAWVGEHLLTAAEGAQNYSRDDALKELDSRIAASGSYQLLQRTGVMAPLLGVMITVIGFFRLDVSAIGEQTLQNMLYAVIPLIVGVGVGALLAFVNQWLLQIAGSAAERVRAKARQWFDAAIWDRRESDPEGGHRGLVAGLKGIAESMEKSTKTHAANLRELGKGTLALRQAAESLQETSGWMRTDMSPLPGQLADLQKSLAAATAAMGEMVPRGEQIVLGLGESVAVFQAAVEREFPAAAEREREFMEHLAAASERIEQTTARLEAGSGQLSGALESHTDAFDALSESLQKQVLPAHEAFHETVTRFNETLAQFTAAGQAWRHSVEEQLTPSHESLREAAESLAASSGSLSAFIRDGLDPATQRLVDLDDTLARMAEAAERLREFAKVRDEIAHLTESLARAAAVTDAIAALPEQLRGLLEEVVRRNGPARPSLIDVFRGRGR